MKNYLIFILLSCSLHLYSQNYNIVLRDTVMFPGQSLANIWGFKKGGKEYALVGASKGLIIVDVTDPNNCFRVGNQLTDYINSSWREVKTFGNYAYITSEGTTPAGTPTPPGVGTGGLGIVDLSGLPGAPPTTVTKYYGDGEINNLLHRAHALHVDTIRSMLYLYGASGVACNGALRFDLGSPLNSPISSPLSPKFVDKYCADYVHDGYVHKDSLFGALIFAGKMSIIKFEYNPFSGLDTLPYLVGDIVTPNAFTHNTWLSANRQYAFTTDEKSNSYLTAYDVSDRTNLVEKDKIRTGTTNSIVHNTYIYGNHAVSSWYEDGVTLTDISRPTNLIQTGRYDTYATPPFPVSTNPNGHYDGAWGVYPYLPSGNLLVTNITENKVASNVDTGVLYILTPTYVSACYLEGNVKDSLTSANLSNATVAIQYTDPLNSTTTNALGNYATGQPTAGTFNVVYSATGYTSRTVPVLLANGMVKIRNMKLLPVGYGNPCPVDSTLSVNPSDMDTVSASNNLITSGAVNIVGNNVVVFRAGTSILLAADFSTQLGSDFTAHIEDCSAISTAVPPINEKEGINNNQINGASFRLFDSLERLIKRGKKNSRLK